MLWVPQKGIVRVEHNLGTVGVAQPGTSVTTGAASATKGTPAEIFAATAFDSYWMTVIAHGYAAVATASDGAMDILTGAATEDVLVPNLLFGYCGTFTLGCVAMKRWDFPLYVPAGTRISVQAAGLRTSTAFRVAMYLYGGHGIPPWRVGTRVDTYGMGTVPNGTSITPGASGAEGSWTEITSATGRDHFALVPSLQVTNDSTMNIRGYMLDLGIGAAAAEEEIAQSFFYWADSNEIFAGPFNALPAFVDVPSGTRLAMRVSNSGANDGGYDAAIHGVS